MNAYLDFPLRGRRPLSGLLAAVLAFAAAAGPAAAEDPAGGRIRDLKRLLLDPASGKKWEAIRELKGFKDRAVEVLVDASEGPGSADPERIEALIKALGSEEFDAREAAQKELTALGSAARPFLEKEKDSADLETRGRIRAILDILSAPDATSPDRYAEQALTDALGYIGSGRGVPFLLARLKSGATATRASALFGLAEIGEPSALPDVVPLLADPDSGVKAAAAYAAARLLTRDTLPALLKSGLPPPLIENVLRGCGPGIPDALKASEMPKGVDIDRILAYRKKDSIQGFIPSLGEWMPGSDRGSVEGRGTAFLYTRESYEDFEWEFDFRLGAGGNGSFMVRGLYDIEAAQNENFFIYEKDEGEAELQEETPLSFNVWYRMKIRVEGSRFEIWCNDKKVYKAADGRWAKGPVGFYTFQTVASFRNSRVKRLPAEEGEPPPSAEKPAP